MCAEFVISTLPRRSPSKLPVTLTVCKQSKRGKIVSFTATCRSDLKKKDKFCRQSSDIEKNLLCQFYLSFIGRFSFKRKRFPSFLILPISVLLRSRLNNRGEYLSYRDPEWWIQSNNTPWRNPYARWGNENGTSLYEERYIRPEFVVSVDTSNPNIRRLLEDGLDMAEDMIREKASFAIEVR